MATSKSLLSEADVIYYYYLGIRQILGCVFFRCVHPGWNVTLHAAEMTIEKESIKVSDEKVRKGMYEHMYILKLRDRRHAVTVLIMHFLPSNFESS